MTTKKPTIELKRIEVHARLSEETCCYTAKLYVDGTYFADVSNRGHGGPDDFHPPKGVAFNDGNWNQKLRDIEAAVAETFDKIECDWGDKKSFDTSLECVCQGIAFEEIDRKNFRSQMSRKVFIQRDGKIMEMNGKKSSQMIEFCRGKYGAENVLNLLGFDAAWTMVKANT